MTGPERRYPHPDDDGRGQEPQQRPDVEAFFAAHRDRVPELTPDELTWRRIREEHRRRGRTARRTSLAGMTVAAAALAIGTYAVWPYVDPQSGPTAQQGGAPGPVATEEAGEQTGDEAGSGVGPLSTGTGETPGEVAGTTAGPAPPDETTATAAPGPGNPLDPGELPDPVAAGPAGPEPPADLVLTAVSQDDQGGMTAVGAGDDERGPLLLRAPDRTGPWEVAADLAPLAWSGEAGAEPDQAVVAGVEFADPETGYAWADEALHLTTDGGATWQRLPLEGLLVHDVLVRDGTVHVAVTGTDCQDGACTGLSLLTGPAGVPELAQTPVAAEGAAVRAPVLRAAGAEVYLHAPADSSGTGEAATGSGSWRWQDGRAEPLALPMECGGPAQALAGAPGQPGFVATACPGQGEDPLLVAASALGGRTWGAASPEAVAAPEDGAPTAGGVHLAVADPSRLALVTGEQTRTSTDGGRTWQQAPEPLPLPAAEVAELGSLRDGTLVALEDPQVAEPGGYWASTDGGQRWQRVPLQP